MRSFKCTLSLAAVCIVALGSVSCSGSDPDVVETPVRVGTYGTGSASLQRSYTFAEAFDEADIVVDITIASWLREETDNSPMTFFRATVNSVFKGKCGESIVIRQTGTGEMTLIGYPLFKVGDRLFLFLAIDKLHDETYVIKGNYSTVMDIQTVGGVTYVLDRYGFVTEAPDVRTGLEPSKSFNVISLDTQASVRRQMKRFDPVLAEAMGEHASVVLYSDLMDYTITLVSGETR